MKYFLSLALLLITSVCSAQKFALLDKKLTAPVTYTNIVTIQDDYNGFFAVEKSTLNAFVSELEKIAKQLNGKGGKPESFNYSIGSTKFIGLKVHEPTEERLDVVLITDCGSTKTTIHLSDAKTNNANNAFFINTWIKYIRSYLK